jgi:hypothetical protein
MQVASTGQVLIVASCSGITTTTTTTTLPTSYYDATPCAGGATVLISHQSFSTLSPGEVVKCTNNVCYTIVNSASPGAAVSNVLFTYDNCVDCTGITTTTTTSTTTTSTTTTTTTTTTTAAPPVSSFFRHGDADTICESPIAEFFIDGAAGSIGNSIYEYVLGVYVLAPANYYLQLATTVAYEWDGTNWTGNSTLCV